MAGFVGILETALHVADLRRARRFYEDILGLEPMAQDERFCAYPVAGRQVLLLFRRGGSLHPIPTPGGMIPPHDGAGALHMAFAVTPEDMASWEQRLGENGVPIESTVSWERGGRSIYFRDPDGHLLEMATPGIWPVY